MRPTGSRFRGAKKQVETLLVHRSERERDRREERMTIAWGRDEKRGKGARRRDRSIAARGRSCSPSDVTKQWRRLRGERLVERNDGRRACQSIARGAYGAQYIGRIWSPLYPKIGVEERVRWKKGDGRLRQEVSFDPKACDTNAHTVSFSRGEWKFLFFYIGLCFSLSSSVEAAQNKSRSSLLIVYAAVVEPLTKDH